MISRISGKITRLSENAILLKNSGITYDIAISSALFTHLKQLPPQDDVEIVTYHYYNIDQNRGYPILIGFNDELERDFFENFISVSGIGPRAALKAFARPVAEIAGAIENGDLKFLQSLSGIGNQRAKQIVAQLQGKVGRFALIKDIPTKIPIAGQEIAQQAKQILKRLGYTAKEIDEMVDNVVKSKPQITEIEDLLNEIYRQKKVTHGH